MIDKHAIWANVAEQRTPLRTTDGEWFRLLQDMTMVCLLVALLLAWMWLDTRRIEKELFSKPAAHVQQTITEGTCH